MEVTVSDIRKTTEGADTYTLRIDNKKIHVKASSTEFDNMVAYSVRFPNGTIEKCIYDIESDSMFDTDENLALFNITKNQKNTNQTGGGIFSDVTGYAKNLVAVHLKNKTDKVNSVKRSNRMLILLMLLLSAGAIQQMNTIIPTLPKPPTAPDVFEPDASGEALLAPVRIAVEMTTPRNLITPIIESGTICTFLHNIPKMTMMIPGEVKSSETKNLFDTIPLPQISLQDEEKVPKIVSLVTDDFELEDAGMVTLENIVTQDNPILQTILNETTVGTQCLIDSILAGEYPIIPGGMSTRITEALNVHKERIIDEIPPEHQQLYTTVTNQMNNYIEDFEETAETMYHSTKFIHLNTVMLEDTLKILEKSSLKVKESVKSAVSKAVKILAKGTYETARWTIQTQWTEVSQPIIDGTIKVGSLLVMPMYEDNSFDDRTEWQQAKDLLNAVGDLAQGLKNMAASVEWPVMSASSSLDKGISPSIVKENLQIQNEIMKTQGDDTLKAMDKVFQLTAKETTEVLPIVNAGEELFTKWDRFAEGFSAPKHTVPVKESVLMEKFVHNLGDNVDMTAEDLKVLAPMVDILQDSSEVNVVPLKITSIGSETTLLETPSSKIIVSNTPAASNKRLPQPHSINDPFSPVKDVVHVKAEISHTKVETLIQQTVNPLVIPPNHLFLAITKEIPVPTVDIVSPIESPVTEPIVVDPIPVPAKGPQEDIQSPIQVMNEKITDTNVVLEEKKVEANAKPKTGGWYGKFQRLYDHIQKDERGIFQEAKRDNIVALKLATKFFGLPNLFNVDEEAPAPSSEYQGSQRQIVIPERINKYTNSPNAEPVF